MREHSTPSMCRIRSSKVVAGRKASEVRLLHMATEFTGGMLSGANRIRVNLPGGA